MSYSGIVQDGVVVFDSAPPLPNGTRVDIVVQELASNPPTLRERLAKLAGTIDDLPADMARNHDHYIHGASKK